MWTESLLIIGAKAETLLARKVRKQTAYKNGETHNFDIQETWQ